MKKILFKQFLETAEKLSHENSAVSQKITTSLDLIFIDEKDSRGSVCFANSPELRNEFKEAFTKTDLFNYCYAVLFSSRYRGNPQELLEMNYSSSALETDRVKFWNLVQLGKELCKSHKLENNINIPFPFDGDGIVKEIHFLNSVPVKGNFKNEKSGRIYLNGNQYFDNVPQAVWNLRIGNYRPAQKWLEDHKGSELTAEDVIYYQKTIASLAETDKIAKIIDSIFS